MDRDELDERIRQRRGADAPYRRGMLAEDARPAPGGPGPPLGPAFVREPTDTAPRHEADAPVVLEPRVDNTPAGFDDQAPVAVPPLAAPPLAGAPSAFPGRRAEYIPPVADAPPAAIPPAVPIPRPVPPRGAQYVAADEPEDDPFPYRGPYVEEDEPRRNNGAALVLAFLGLGVLALLGGAILSAMLTGNIPGVGRASPTPTAAAGSTAPATSGSVTPAPSDQTSGSPTSSAPPGGFAVQAQPCAQEPIDQPSGCQSSGSTVSGGKVWIWAGFQKATPDDVLGVQVLTSSGAKIGDASIDLKRIGCTSAAGCNGYTYFPFSNLAPGTYVVKVTRNTQPAAQTGFTVQ